jgi:hypothetical protein
MSTIPPYDGADTGGVQGRYTIRALGIVFRVSIGHIGRHLKGPEIGDAEGVGRAVQSRADIAIAGPGKVVAHGHDMRIDESRIPCFSVRSCEVGHIYPYPDNVAQVRADPNEGREEEEVK